MLAWWRTGLAALAVALAVGRLLPEITGKDTTWPYVLLGTGFAFYAIGLFIYGGLRGAQVGARLPVAVLAIAGGGLFLAILTLVFIATG